MVLDGFGRCGLVWAGLVWFGLLVCMVLLGLGSALFALVWAGLCLFSLVGLFFCADLGWSVLVLGGCGWLCVVFACLYSFGLICVRLGLGWLVVA